MASRKLYKLSITRQQCSINAFGISTEIYKNDNFDEGKKNVFYYNFWILFALYVYIYNVPTHAIFVKMGNLQMFTWIVFLFLIPNIFSSDNSFQKFILHPLKYGFLSISEEIQFCFIKLMGNNGRNKLNTFFIW